MVGVSVTVAVIALGLGVLALLSRNQAVASANSSRALALATESQNELTVDPEVSVALAREAVALTPIPQAVSALRQAMDASAARVALPSVPPEQCGFNSGPSIAYSPDGQRLAESLCNGDLVVMNSTTGRVLLRRHVAAQASAIAYQPNGHLLAVGTNAASTSSTRPPACSGASSSVTASPTRWPSTTQARCWLRPPTSGRPSGI